MFLGEVARQGGLDATLFEAPARPTRRQKVMAIRGEFDLGV